LKPKPKGNKAVFLVLFLHMLLILLFAGYIFCLKFPVLIWDDGLFLNRKFIDSAKGFLISTLEIWFGAPVLIAVANAVFVKRVSMKYLQYLEHVRQMCGNAETYFREHYPEQQEAIAQTTYFSGRIELLQKDAQNLRPEKLTAVFSNLRQCRNLEKEFRELARRCETMKHSHMEQDFAQILHDDFRNYLTYSAVLLNQYYPEQMHHSFSELEQYLSLTSGRPKPEHLFQETGYESDTDFLLAELYAPLETLAQDLRIIAEYLTDSYSDILAQNGTSEMEILPLPEEMSGRLHEISALLEKIPSGAKLRELSAQEDRKTRKQYLSCREKFRNYQASVSAYDSCIGLYYQYITDAEHQLLEQLLSHYRIVQKAYRMYLPEDSPYTEEISQAYEALKSETEANDFIWHLYYLHIFSQTQHRQCDVSLSSQDAQNLQNRLDAVKSCAETINQTIRKDEITA